MNLRSVAEVAAITAWYGADELEEYRGLQQSSLAEYWKTTRFLCRRWTRQLRPDLSVPNHNVRFDQLAAEIIVSELLTRCLGANLFVLGEITSQPEFSQIAERTLAEHATLREKVVSKLDQCTNQAPSALRINRLLRKTERWTDLFISRHSTSDAALEAAFDCERCLDFADDWHMQKTIGTPAVSLHLQMSALVLAIPNQEINDAVNAQAHENRTHIALSFLNDTPLRKQAASIPRVQRMILASSGSESRPFNDSQSTREM